MCAQPAPPPGRGILRGISRNTLVLGLVSFLNDISADMVAPLVPVFLKSVLRASTVWIGVVEGVAQATASVLKPFSGWFSDRLRKRRPGIFSGYLVSTLTRPLLAMSGMAWHVLGLRFTDRVGKGLRTAPRDALIADSTPDGFRGKAYGLHRALDNAGAAVGFLIAALLLKGVTSDLRVVFWAASVPGLAALCVVLWGVREQAYPAAEADAPPQGLKAPLTGDLTKWYASVFVFWLGNSADAFLILKARLLGMPIWQMPLLMFGMSIVRTLFATPAGMLSDKIGRKWVIVTGWVYYAVVYVGFAFADEAWMMFALFAAYGLYYAITEGPERALVVDLAPAGARATALGIYHFVVGAAALPASIVCGLLWSWSALGVHGPRVALGFGAACALCASVLFAVLGPTRPAKQH